MSTSNPIMLAGLNLLLGFYSPFTRAWEFVAGCLIAFALRRAGRRVGWAPTLLAAAGCVTLLASLFVISDTTPFPGFWTLMPVAGTAALIAAGSVSNPVSKLLSHRMLVWIGDLSYSLYLWHWPLIVFAKQLWPTKPEVTVLAGILSIAPAYVSYRWVEVPFRRKAFRRRFLPAWVAAITVPVLAFSAALLFAAQRGFWSTTVQNFQQAVLVQHIGERKGCDRIEPLSAETARRCTFNPEATGKTIYLLGDSHADHFSEAVIEAGKTLNRPVVISTLSNCPFLQASFVRLEAQGPVNERCRLHTTGTLSYLMKRPASTVIISSTDQMWISVHTALGYDASSVTQDRAEQLRVLNRVLTRTVETLQTAGHQVLLVQDIPMRPGQYAFRPHNCTILKMRHPGECGQDMPISVSMEKQEPVREVLLAVARKTNAGVVDPVPYMCQRGVCPVTSGALIRMRDPGHISNAQSEALGHIFVSAMEAT